MLDSCACSGIWFFMLRKYEEYDRIWEINMPAFNDNDKKLWYTTLSNITNQNMSYFFVDYCRKLMMNYDSVMDDIKELWECFKLPTGITRETRIADHFEFIVLSEYLLKKYYLFLSDVSAESICNNNSYLIKKAVN